VHNRWIAILILIMAAPLVLAGCKTTRSGHEGYESAPIRSCAPMVNIKIRDCQALTVVEPPMAYSGHGAVTQQASIAFSASSPAATTQKIAMTTPLLMSGSETKASRAFVMPTRFKTRDLPKPKDEQLRLRELEAGGTSTFMMHPAQD